LYVESPQDDTYVHPVLINKMLLVVVLIITSKIKSSYPSLLKSENSKLAYKVVGCGNLNL